MQNRLQLVGDSKFTLTLQTGDTDIAQDDVHG